MDFSGFFGVIQFVENLIPKKVSLELHTETNNSGYKVNITNTTGRLVEILDIRINGKQIKSNFFILEHNRGYKFILQNNSPITLTIIFSKDDETPKSIQFFVKSRLGKTDIIEFII